MSKSDAIKLAKVIKANTEYYKVPYGQLRDLAIGIALDFHLDDDFLAACGIPPSGK